MQNMLNTFTFTPKVVLTSPTLLSNNGQQMIFLGSSGLADHCVCSHTHQERLLEVGTRLRSKAPGRESEASQPIEISHCSDSITAFIVKLETFPQAKGYHR